MFLDKHVSGVKYLANCDFLENSSRKMGRSQRKVLSKGCFSDI
jgi:hypothetical protein